MRRRSDSPEGRRLLLAAGTAHFRGRSPLTGVPEEIDEIVATFSELDYERQLSEFSLNPTSETLRTLLRDFKSQSQTDDLVIVYYTSHGDVDPKEQNRFYVLTSDTGPCLSASAVSAEDMARALISESKTSQFILILDVCYAEAGATEFLTVAGRFAEAARGFAPELFILAAAREEATQGALSAALKSAFENKFGKIEGRTTEYLSPDNLMQEVNDHLKSHPPLQVAQLFNTPLVGTCRLFRNPYYLPGVQVGSSLEFQQSVAAAQETTTLDATDVSAWYFTGRQQALNELSRWLEQDQSDGAVRVITGSPGCGKSALLARFASIASSSAKQEPIFQSATVSAHGKLLSELTSGIAQLLGVQTENPAHLVSAIADLKVKYVIAVDGLDEAEQPAEIATRLLIPLAELENMFLIVATRPDSVGGEKRVAIFGDASGEIDLDAARYIGAHDVVQYVERRLISAEDPSQRTPYRGMPEVAREVARVVAMRAHDNFLVATTAMQALMAADTAVDISREGWISEIPDGLDKAFAKFLSTIETRRDHGVSSEVVRSVLLALAFAEGEGLPWVNIWPTIASGLSNATITDAAIAAVQKCAAAFIVEGSEHNGSVYRLYHELLAQHLRVSGGAESSSQQRILESLVKQIPSIGASGKCDWRRAHPYLLTHSSGHALKGERLDWMLEQGDDYLAFADPPRMLLSLSRSHEPQSSQLYPVYAIAIDRIRREEPSVRRAYLEMTARQQHCSALLSMLGGSALAISWQIPWAQWTPVSVHRSIHLGEKVLALALGKVEDRTVLITGGTSKTVRVWDLTSGEQVGVGLIGNRFPVRAVGLMFSKEGPLVVAGGDDKTIRIWALDGREHSALPGHSHRVTSLALTQSGSLVVSGGLDGRMMTWDPSLGARVGRPMIGKEEGVKAVAIGELSGKAVAIAGSANGAISVWDPSMSQRVEIPRIAHMAPILALVYVVIAGSPSVVVGYHDGFIRIWSLIDGKPLVSPILAHEGGVRALAVGSFNELSVIVSGGGAGDGAGGGEVRIWDLLTCRPLETLQGHNGPVNSIVIGRLESRSVIVSGSDDGTARVWDISPNWTKSGPSHSKGSIGCVAVSEYAGEFIAATGGYQRSFEVWNSSTGTLLHTFGAAASSEPVAIAAGTSSKGTLVLAACAGETVRLWQELPRNKQLDNVHHHQHRVTALALSLIDEANSVVATAIEDGTLRLLSVASPDLFCGPFRLKQRSRVRALTFGECQGKPMLISGDDDGVIQAWNVSNGNEMFQLLAHRSAVRSLYFCEHGDIPAIVSCGEDKMTVVWDADGRAFRMAQMIEHDSIVTSASLLPTQGNRIVVSGCIDGTIRLHHESGHLILSIDTGSEVVGLAVVDDDDLAVATKRGLMRIRIKDSIADFLWRRGFSPVA